MRPLMQPSLSLFPNFVHDFNQLLLPESQVVNKKDKRLNTELRICALIRLGISDNERFGCFLKMFEGNYLLISLSNTIEIVTTRLV